MNINDYYLSPTEKPLDIIKPDGGFTAIFRTIACVGDSLASGEFESTSPDGGKGYHDFYEYSWGQYIARATGAKVYNFSCGGMTAGYYYDVWGADHGLWDYGKAAQAYIIALGANDVLNPMADCGSVDDIDFENPENSKKTFAGFYGKLILKYKKISPKARFFLVTMPREVDDANLNQAARDKVREQHAALLHDIAAKLDFTYVIDLYKYAPVYDEKFKENFYLGGHMNASGYLLTANIFMSYIDYLIRSNPEDFAQVGFIGTEWHNESRKW